VATGDLRRWERGRVARAARRGGSGGGLRGQRGESEVAGMPPAVELGLEAISDSGGGGAGGASEPEEAVDGRGVAAARSFATVSRPASRARSRLLRYTC